MSLIRALVSLLSAPLIFMSCSGRVLMPDIHIGGVPISALEYARALTSCQDGMNAASAEKPEAVNTLTEAALDLIKNRLAIYLFAKENGYIADASYEAMLSRMEDENRLRQSVKESGGTVYGLLHFSADTWLAYESASFKTRWIDSTGNEEFAYLTGVNSIYESLSVTGNLKALYRYTLSLL